MPGGDRTGPMGNGAMRGRAAGFCAGFDAPGYTDPAAQGGAGMRMGRRRGGWGSPSAGGQGWLCRSFAARRMGRRGMGRYAFWSQPLNPDRDMETLKNRSQALASELAFVNSRLRDIESQEKEP